MTRVLFLKPMLAVAELIGIAWRAVSEAAVASHDEAERLLPHHVRTGQATELYVLEVAPC